MKITPIPSAASAGAGPEGLRTLTMNVNRTPPPTEAPPLQTPIAKPEEIKDNGARLESEAEATQPISHQFAQLRKAQRAVQAKEAELKARETELGKKFSDTDFVPVSQLKQGPLKTLLSHGVTYDQLTQEILQNQSNPEINELKAELKALKEGVDTKFTEAQELQIQQAKVQLTKDATALVDSNDDYALIRATGTVSDVVRLIETVYRKSGEQMSLEEACKLVEAEHEIDAEKYVGVDKIKNKFAPPTPQPQARYQGMRTLTNRDTATPPLDRRARALAAFYGRPIA